MTEEELVDCFYEEGFATKTAARQAYKALCSLIAAELRGGGDVPLSGVGKLKPKAVAERERRNPKTGERVVIPAGLKVRFVSSKALKNSLKH